MNIIHVETLTQMITGILLSTLILHLWGLPFMEATQLQAVFVVVSYIRSYCIRKLFSNYTGDIK